MELPTYVLKRAATPSGLMAHEQPAPVMELDWCSYLDKIGTNVMLEIFFFTFVVKLQKRNFNPLLALV